MKSRHLLAFMLLIALLGSLSPLAIQSEPERDISQAAAAPPVYKGLWMSEQELDSLPTSGSGWTNLKAAADSGSWGLADLDDHNTNHDVNTLAGALVFARLYPSPTAEPYRARVAAAIMSAVGTAESDTLGLGRNLSSYVVAADLINLPAYDAAKDSTFRAWLADIRTKVLADGNSLVRKHETRLNNHGTMAGAGRIAADIYLGDTAELKRAADVFRGWLGDSTVYSSFNSREGEDWRCGSAGVNPTSCIQVISGAARNLSGVLPSEQVRCGSITWPPCRTNYVWGGLQGASVQAELLRRQGFPVLTWGSAALKRVADRYWEWDRELGDWWGTGGSADSEWVPSLFDFWFGGIYRDLPNSGHGKNMGWTEWTHASRTLSTSPAPVPPPAPVPTPAPGDEDSGIALIASRRAQNGSDSNALVVPRPSRAKAGDILLATIDVRGNPLPTASGWRLIRADDNGSISYKATYYRKATSAEPSSYSFGLRKALPAAGAVMVFRGADSANPILSHGGRVNPFSTGVIAPSASVSVSGAMLLFLEGSAGATSVTPPLNMAEAFEVTNTSGRSKLTSEGAVRLLDGPGLVPVLSAAQTVSLTSIGQTVVLRPAS